jgi:Trk K+ transport system NAD-binding subunit
MKETGGAIANEYDKLIVYEKIDGYWRKPVNVSSMRFPQVVGRTSKILSDAIRQKNQNVELIMREDLAIARAAEIAKPGDVVVVIVNDDIKRSLEFIQKSFKADFV